MPSTAVIVVSRREVERVIVLLHGRLSGTTLLPATVACTLLATTVAPEGIISDMAFAMSHPNDTSSASGDDAVEESDTSTLIVAIEAPNANEATGVRDDRLAVDVTVGEMGAR